MAASFVPDNFDVPNGIAAPGGTLRLLTMDHLAQDFDAYMSSIDKVSAAFDPQSEPWPYPGLSMRLALADLGFCEWEHHCRASFSYGVFTAGDARELGCIYVNPTIHPGSGAEVWTWTREDGIEEGYDDTLFGFAKHWVAKDWPFEAVAYPGREHDWADCRQPAFLPNGFAVPDDVAFEAWRMVLLTMDHTRLDYEAYMSNIDHLRGVLGPDFETWPNNDLTPRLALADLGWCEWKHHHKSCFSYGIFAPDMSQEVGCLYVSPSKRPDYDAEICFWFVEELSAEGVEERFMDFARTWLAQTWPFARIAFPGREIPWADW